MDKLSSATSWASLEILFIQKMSCLKCKPGNANCTDSSSRLTRAAYLGHLRRSHLKGNKINSIERPAPTFTGWGNILIKDDRDPQCCGLRYLSVEEILRLNNFPPRIVEFLRSIAKPNGNKTYDSKGTQRAMNYIANSIPTGTLHAIYSAVLADLDLEDAGLPRRSRTMTNLPHCTPAICCRYAPKKKS